MDSDRFDGLTRSFSTLLSRRFLVGALALGVLALPGSAEAKKHKHKRKNKKVRRNEFGCVNVGGFCKSADQCCSGICEGKKDKKKCQAHDTGGCTLERNLCFDSVTPLCAPEGFCVVTTGNAPFCAKSEGGPDAFCQPCGRDLDCEELGFGAGAACVVLRTEGLCVNGCEGINGSAGTGCLQPGRA